MRYASVRLKRMSCVLIVALLAWGKSFSQVDKLSLPDLLPPSPEVNSMINNGYGNLQRNSGAVNVSIPICEIKVNGFVWPVSIGYTSQGLKIDETSSRVGYGWTLNANGVISRMVKDDPDDVATRLTPPSNLGQTDNANLLYAYNISDEESPYDGEYDVYNYSFNGLAGKMVFNDSNQAIVTAHNNLRIERSGWHTFTITTTDGVKYHFGGDEYERTITHSLKVGAMYKNNTRTAYFLSQIDLPNGGWIKFKYTSIDIFSKSGMTQSLVRTGVSDDDPCQICPTTTTEELIQNVNSIEYRTRYLASITSSVGHVVSFGYAQRPDYSGDNRLTGINAMVGSTTIKNMQFVYTDPPGFGGPTVPATPLPQISRYFLTKLIEQPMTDDGVYNPTGKVHEFTYHNLANHAGEPFSKAQDYWGFYNGNTGNLLTASPMFPTSVTVNGNRLPNPELAMNGMLTSIKYPTGGYENFYYEANTLPKTTVHNYPKVYVNVVGFFQGGGTYYTYSSNLFTVPVAQTVNVDLNAYYQSGTPTYDPQERIVTFYVKRNTDTLITEFMNGNNNRTIPLTLTPGYTYQFLIRIRQDFHNGGEMSMYYDTTFATYSTRENEITGGLRLRKIAYLDRTGNVAKKKFFRYATASAVQAAGFAGFIAEASGHTRGYLESESRRSIWCTNTVGTYGICKSYVLTSNTSYNMNEYDGSNVYYPYVTESDDSLFANGCTEYTYSSYDVASNTMVLRGDNVDNAPTGNYGTLNGIPETIRQYDNNLNIVAEQQDIYEFGLIEPSRFLTSIYAQRRYLPILNSLTPEREMNAFNLGTYRHFDRWPRVSKTITKKWENGNLTVDTTTYAYGSQTNILPSQTITVNSKGQQLKTVQTYPTDAPTTGVFASMISANQITAPYETSFYIDNVLQQQKRIKYKNIHSALYVPDTVQLKSSPTDLLSDEQYFKVYDSAGNPVQFNKWNDASMVYLWDHAKSFVVAQVMNAQASQVAYGSFEGESWGNWKPVAGAVINSGGFMGARSFTGTLRDTVSIAGTYVVTAWGSAGVPTVNGTAGTAVLTKGSWTLYRWTLTNPTAIAIVGTRIDEVRLHPVDAKMITVAHLPYVGVIAQCDLNNKVVRYEYDAYNRLALIRDEDSNIVKKICYNYTGEIEACGIQLFQSIAKSGTFTRSNCGTNGSSTSVTYTVAAGTYRAPTQAQADSLAQADVDQNGQAYANAQGVCSWGNQAQSVSYTRNNCADGGTGSTVTYTITAFSYSSNTSLADANQQALNAANTGGQAYANANGSCTWTNQQQSTNFQRNNCGTNGTGGIVAYTVNAGVYTSTISLADANQQAINAVNAGGQAYANANAACTWTNQQQSGTFTRNNCGTNYIGSQVLYTVSAGTYSSTTSLAAANQLAINAVNAGGQAYANTNGTCTVDCAAFCVQNDKKCIDNVCVTGTAIEIDCAFDPETNKYKHWFAYRFPDGSWSTYTYYVIRPDACAID